MDFNRPIERAQNDRYTKFHTYSPCFRPALQQIFLMPDDEQFGEYYFTRCGERMETVLNRLLMKD